MKFVISGFFILYSEKNIYRKTKRNKFLRYIKVCVEIIMSDLTRHVYYQIQIACFQQYLNDTLKDKIIGTPLQM